MTPEAQRIAIAEQQGCKWYKHIVDGREYRVLQWFPCNQTPAGGTEPMANIAYIFGHGVIPDYPGDLNAIQDAVMSLPEDMQWKFQNELLHMACTAKGAFPFSCATAAQRAEAFLRTIGKWQETAPAQK